MDSPRRSPRISARTSLEAQQRSETTPTSSPLSARSPDRQNRQPLQQTHLSVPKRSAPIMSHSEQIPNKARASTSNVTLNMSSNGRPTESPNKRIKLARRAYSVGGMATQKVRDPNNVSVPSRRNVPGPRKSAIRTLPPQVFASPSELSPRPSIRPLFSRKSLGLEAFGGSDLMGLMKSIGIIKSQEGETNKEEKQTEKSKQARKSEPVGSGGVDSQGDTGEVENQQEQKANLERKKRRVTFNPYQEKTNFEKDEPTMRIRPATELDQVLETSNSDGSASPSQSSSASTSSSDMSLDSDSENEDSESQLAAEEMDEEEEDFESEAEVEGELEENTQNMDNESAMDITAAYGGMQDATLTGIAHGFTDDEDSMSMQDSSSIGDASSVLDDMTVTMQLTEMHDSNNDSTFQTHAIQEMEDEELLDEDDIEVQLSQQNETTHADVEEEVDMELTEVEVDNEQTEIESVKDESESEMELVTSPIQPIKTASPVREKSTSLSPVVERSPLRSRSIPNGRISNPPQSPKRQVRQSIMDENANQVKEVANSPTSPQRRQSMLERRKSDSPRRGHEYCHVPAADSPKPRVSATTLRVQARKEASQSPSKNAGAPLRTSIGKRPSSPDKMPFRSSSSSSSSPRKSIKTERSQDISAAKISTARASIQNSIHTSSSPRPQARHTSPASPSPRRSAPSSPRRSTGPGSPLRSPSSPSRTWQTFREGQQEPSTPKSPAKRISMAREDSNAFTFGSPQRIALPSPTIQREVGRSLNVSNTPAKGTRTTKATESSPSNPEPQLNSESADRWTMKRFFDMLEIGFLDLSMPSKRKIENYTEHDTPSMNAKIRAACSTVPNLDGLISACKELKSSVEDGRMMLDEIEKEFYENPPSYVAEVLAMESSSDRQKAISSFKIQKSAARAIALKAYYGWRTDKQFDDTALLEMENTKSSLERDLITMKDANEAIGQFALPKLRSQSSLLEEKLKQTRKRQREIDEWDVEEMRAMHSAMQEQNAILEEQRAMHSETKEQLIRLQSRLEELQQRKQIAEEAITNAHASSAAIHSSTRTEAKRLAKHLDQIETLHLWNVHSATMNSIEMMFNGNEIWVKMILSKSPHPGTVKSVEMRLQNDGVVERMAIDAIQQHLDERLESQFVKPTEIIRLITTAWTRFRSFSTTFSQLQAHYPSSIVKKISSDTMTKSPTIIIQSMILFNKLRTKILISARCSTPDLFNLRKPLFLPEDIDCECVYGRSGAASALNARICDTLLGGTPNDLCHAILTAVTTMNEL